MNLILKRITLFFCTLVLIILISEALLRVAYPFYSNYNTESWRYASESKQVSDSKQLGHEHVPNKTNQLYGVEIKTNSYGFRADKEYSTEKPDSIKRVLVLGDSITMGWGVSYNETYPAVLGSLLNSSFEVINAGVGNYNSLNELAALKKFMHLNPDIIILGFYINDIETIKYPTRITYFIKKNSYLYSFFLDRIINILYRQNNFEKYYSNLYQDEVLRNNLKENLNEMIEIAEANSIPFVFVNIPEFHGFENYPFYNVNEFIKDEVINNKSIIYIDMLQAFQKQPIPANQLWVSSEDPHPNAKGHQIIANEIYKELINIQ